MSLSPIAFIAPNYRDFSTWWLKAYQPSTTTPKTMSLDISGSTLVSKLQLNSDGFLIASGGSLVIPYIDNPYDLWLFPSEAEADNNDTSNAKRVADNIKASSTNGSFTINSTTELIASSFDVSADAIITTSGFTTSGDGGSGQWKQNGVTGQAVNQTPAQLGVGLLNDGLGNQWEIILTHNTIDVRSLGAVGDYSEGTDTGTDNALIIQAAMDNADYEDGVIVTGGNGQYGLSTGVRHKFRRIFLKDMVLCALSGYNAGNIDATDMGSAEDGTITAQMITNRGNPLHRCWRRDTPVSTQAAFIGGGTENIKYLCNDRAPGASFEDCFNFHVKNPTCFKQYKYGIAWLVKNTDSSMSKAKVYEADFGDPKQADPVSNPYNSFGIVQTCADLHLTDCISNYSLRPIWADGFFNTQWSGLHLYNGNGIAAALPNMYLGPNCGGVQSVNLYNDNGYLELLSFNHSFSGGRFVSNSATVNINYALLKATQVNQVITGLLITNISCGTGAPNTIKTIALTESDGNGFSDVKNSKVSALVGLDSPMQTLGYLTSKQIDISISAGQWISDSGRQRYTVDLMPYVLINESTSRLQTEIQLSANLVTAPPTNSIQVAFDGSGAITKNLVLWADSAQSIKLELKLSEGFEQVI